MDKSEKLIKACTALQAAGMGAVADALWRSDATPGLWLLTGSAMSGKSTVVRSALGRCLEAAGKEIPKRARELESSYEFEFELGSRFAADENPDKKVKCSLSFQLGGEPDYKANFPSLLASCYSSEADVILADSFKNLPLYIIREKKQYADSSSQSVHNVGPFSFTESNAIWSGGVTTNTILTVETVTREFFVKDSFVVAAFNPLRFDNDAEYYKLLIGSCQGMLTVHADGSVICNSGRRDVAIPTEGSSLRYSDGWHDDMATVRTGGKFLTPKEEEE